MKAYAENTDVPVERSRAELDTLLGKHGATSRIIGYDDALGVAAVAFTLNGAAYRMRVPMPSTNTPAAYSSWSADQKLMWLERAVVAEQTSKARWRSLVLLVRRNWRRFAWSCRRPSASSSPTSSCRAAER